MGRYNLAVECSLPFELKPIPPEGAGMYSKVVKGAWCVVSPTKLTIAESSVGRVLQLRVVLLSTNTGKTPSMKLGCLAQPS